MKTLDEVIKKIEAAWVCPSSDEADEYCELYAVRDDSLYYLKEYQEMLNNVENYPLSWEELHLLENKPVWVEHKFYKQWAIITGFGVDDNIVRFEGKQLYAPEFKEDMGERWNAYRKERK